MHICLFVAIPSQIGLFGVYPSTVYLGKEGHHVGIQHRSKKFGVQCRMAKALLKAIPEPKSCRLTVYITLTDGDLYTWTQHPRTTQKRYGDKVGSQSPEGQTHKLHLT